MRLPILHRALPINRRAALTEDPSQPNITVATRRDLAPLAATENNELIEGADYVESTMTLQPPIPAVRGIDLSYQPRTYFGPLPLETLPLARVRGHARRELLRAQLRDQEADPVLDLLGGLFEDIDRETLGRIHPVLMGGEYLPAFLPNETEIARISLQSTTADQISVRAQRVGDGIVYRIVDEYPESDPDYVCKPARSKRPLAFRQLVMLIDGALPEGGAALSFLFANISADCGDPWRLRNFVTVSSEFYPQLGAYYDARIATWFAINAPRDDDGDDESDLQADANGGAR